MFILTLWSSREDDCIWDFTQGLVAKMTWRYSHGIPCTYLEINTEVTFSTLVFLSIKQLE